MPIFQALSAVLSGIADVRKALAEARTCFTEGTRTVLFVDAAGGVALDQVLLPDALGSREYYRPAGGGMEAKIAPYLAKLRAARKAARSK